MRKRRILLVMGAAVVLVLGGVFLFPPSEPSYAGRPLSEWVLEYKDTLYKQTNESELVTTQRHLNASNSIVKIGTNANPFILQWMIQYEPQPWKFQAYSYLEKFLHVFHIKWNYRDKNLLLANALSDVFPVIAPSLDEGSINELKKIVNNPSPSIRWQRTVGACSYLGSKGVPILVNALTNLPPRYRANIVGSMWRFGTNGRPLVPLILKCLQDKTEPDQSQGGYMEQNCLIVFRVWKYEPDLVIPAILPFLEDPREHVSCQAFYALEKYGPAARPWATAIMKYTNDPNPHIRDWATNALWHINGRKQ